MKNKILYIVLVAFAAVCAVLGAMPELVSGAFAGLMAFPFEQIGMALRALSLSSGIGNMAAIVLYALINLLPLGWLLLQWRRRGLCNADWLMLLLSAVLFGVHYLMINPALLANTKLGAEGIAVMKAMLGGCCWSIVVAYAVLGLLRSSAEGGREKTLRQLGRMLNILAFFFVALAFGGGVSDFCDSLAKLRESNTMPDYDLSLTVEFLVLQSVAAALPYALDAIVALRGARLMEFMREDAYGEETMARAESLSKLCALCLKITLITCVVINILQLAFAERLLTVDVNVVIPLMSIAFVLLTLTLLGFMRENKSLKDDNDLFI